MGDYRAILPELLLLIPVFWALFANKLPGRDRGAAFVGFAAVVAAAVLAWTFSDSVAVFNGLLGYDFFTRVVRTSVAGLSAIWMLWVMGKKSTRTREAVAAASLVTIGSMFAPAAQELITLLVSLELATLPGYILIGYKRNNRLSLEGALKYFLLSMTTSLVMLYGFSLIYGTAGTTHIAGFQEVVATGEMLPTIAAVLIFVGLFAKLALAPFHFWAPDAYEGTDSWLVAFASTVPKVAAFAVLLRLSVYLAISSSEIMLLITLISVASIIIGNLSALGQSDIRRVMAYSGVAQLGYALIAIVTISKNSSVLIFAITVAMYFVVSYAVAGMGILLAVGNENPTFKKLAGFSKAHPWTAGSAAVLVLSLIGIPPLSGFMGKFYVFVGYLSTGEHWLVIIAIIGSIVSAAYYLRIVKAMFFDKPVPEETPVPEAMPEGVVDGLSAAEASESVEIAGFASVNTPGSKPEAQAAIRTKGETTEVLEEAIEEKARMPIPSAVAVLLCAALVIAGGIFSSQIIALIMGAQ